ncbi:MAG: hypothetical protein ABI625_01210 [bacterium]
MSYLIGVVLALSSAVLAKAIKFDRRTFYASVLIVSATYYVLFAVMAGSAHAMIVESAVMTTFVLFAGVSARVNPWLIVVGFAAHGTLDLVHGTLISNPGVPVWWPPFCMMYDVVASVVYARAIERSSRSSFRKTVLQLARRKYQDARPVL